MKQHILITGGLGYIGSHMAIRLAKNHHEIVIIDNLSNSSLDILQKITAICGKEPIFIRADLTNMAEMRPIFAQYSFGQIYHFGGLKSVNDSLAMPINYYQNNLISTCNLCQLSQEFAVKYLVFSSSATIYGADAPVPYSESAIKSPSTPYGKSKYFCEQIIQDFAHANPAMKYAILRYFNPIGNHESGLIGEQPLGKPNNLMPFIIKVAMQEYKKLAIFGNDYDTPDGTCIRDFIHVEDLITGHELAMGYLITNQDNIIVNLGTGLGISVLNLVETFIKVNQIPINYQFSPRRSGDIACYYADITKAQRLLNFTAQKNIDDICRDSWKFAQNILLAK